MRVARALAEGFPDISEMAVARQIYWRRWLAAAAILVVLAAIGRAFVNGQIEWSYVNRFLTAKVILEGIINTMVMAVLLLDYYEGGNIGITAAFSLVQTVLLAVLIGLAHWLSRGGTNSGVGKAG